MKFTTFSTFTIVASLLVLHGAAAPVDIKPTELGNDDLGTEEHSSEFGSLEEDANNDDVNIVTVNVGFFSYINSALHELMKDKSMDSSEILEFVNDWNSELDKDIVYAESDDMSSSAEDIDSIDESAEDFVSFEDKGIDEIDESIAG
ncbi:hypothetical protein LPJ53_004467 [Coemansia erecta]|uniref:Uncharacterized protein n=1 Tax=Coemansia erecta TaxID=147472 RepID=A0A9W7XYY2_9FUNG|nr:hypothetical protein LPJ53_004467 [Coemansia erecta]